MASITVDPGVPGLLGLARRVVEVLDLEVVLQRVLECARELTGARYAAIGILDESRTGLARFVTLGVDQPTVGRIGRLPRGVGVLGELIRDPRPLRLADIADHPRGVGFPPGHPVMRSFLGVPLAVAGEPYGNLYLAEKRDGELFSAQDEEAVVLLSQFASVAIEHARRYTSSEQRRVALGEQVDALGATVAIARAVAEGADLDALLELVARRARAMVAARVLVIALTHGRELLISAGAGELPDGLLGRRVGLEGTVAGAALRTGETQRLAGAERAHGRFRDQDLRGFGLDPGDGLIVPMIARGGPCGVLVALDPLDGPPVFSSERQQHLEGFATSVAIAIATLRAAAEERSRLTIAAAEHERARWARELHDETLQALANVRLELATARRRDPTHMASAIDHAVAQIEADIDTLRSLIVNLRPATLEELGTEAAILDLAARFQRSGLQIDVSIDLAYEHGRAATRPVPELETAIYRIVQEALTNATRHGGATRAVIEITEQQAITITVRDDGTGFDAAADTPGFGLRGMRERIALLGGTLHIDSAPGDSAPGQGTTLTATLPGTQRAESPPPA